MKIKSEEINSTNIRGAIEEIEAILKNRGITGYTGDEIEQIANHIILLDEDWNDNEDDENNSEEKITLDEIIEDACSTYCDDTGKSRDEIASSCTAYFDADTISCLNDEEVSKHLTRLFESSEDDYNDLEKWGLDLTLEQKLMDSWEKSEYANSDRYPVLDSNGIWTGETAGSDDDISDLVPIRLSGNVIVFVSEDDLQEGADFTGYMEREIDWNDFREWLSDMAIGSKKQSDKIYFNNLAEECKNEKMSGELKTWYNSGNYRE